MEELSSDTMTAALEHPVRSWVVTLDHNMNEIPRWTHGFNNPAEAFLSYGAVYLEIASIRGLPDDPLHSLALSVLCVRLEGWFNV